MIKIIIPVRIFCPHCGARHVDETRDGERWDRRAHTTHRCQNCRQEFDVYVSGKPPAEAGKDLARFLNRSGEVATRERGPSIAEALAAKKKKAREDAARRRAPLIAAALAEKKKKAPVKAKARGKRRKK